MDAKVARQLKINLGAVKRLIKEKSSYEKEVEEANDKIAKSTAEPGSYEHKKLLEMKEEAEGAITFCEKRLNDFKAKIQASLKEAEAFPEDPNVIEAKSLL